ncbi:hypothetical protein QY95_00924 [Bacillus thermotolerans]|uniref:DUF3918 domain-containing protein n=1 Tax=Bacillus thermotolerans TaxID=1221996 RepID=A0A0F5I7R7_BACTR|nr:hypothetical protein QY95_00924 [Bacillus thermotolerans]
MAKQKSMSGKATMTALALGAAFLLRNEKSRNKVMGQLKSLGK